MRQRFDHDGMWMPYPRGELPSQAAREMGRSLSAGILPSIPQSKTKPPAETAGFRVGRAGVEPAQAGGAV